MNSKILLYPMISVLLLSVHFISCTGLPASVNLSYSQTVKESADTAAPPWVSMNGPSGGRILEIAEDPVDKNRLWATGTPKGVYYSENRGLTWDLIPFPEPHNNSIIRADWVKQGILYSNYQGFSRSDDSGLTWEPKGNPWIETGYLKTLLVSRDSPGTLYAGTLTHDNNKAHLFVSDDRGETWAERPGPWDHDGSILELISESRGRLLAGVNKDQEGTEPDGSLYVSEDNGRQWSRMNFENQSGLFIFSLFVDPNRAGEIWVTLGSHFNNWPEQPLIFYTPDEGNSWNPIFVRNLPFDATQVRVIGSGSDGSVYIAAGRELLVTEDSGKNFTLITPNQLEFVGVDYRGILTDDADPERLILPLRASGIAYSEDRGRNWKTRHEGIISSSINLIAVDPGGDDIIFASSALGEGTLRTDDGGQSWIRLNSGGIVHPFGDELVIDPHDPDSVWFITDVPYIHRSRNGGNNWDVIANPRRPGDFAFASVPAMTVTSDGIVFALNDGFGIYRLDGFDGQWKFLNNSEIDYTYSISVERGEPLQIWSGHSKKPFESHSRIRYSGDGGETWSTKLEVPGAEAITSVVPSRQNKQRIWAVSVGEDGGAVWKSLDGGTNWHEPAPSFSFLTIHSFAAAGSTAYAGSWGGGTYVTQDEGSSWELIKDPRLVSAANIVIDTHDSNRIFAADRMSPQIFMSRDGGGNWDTVFDGNDAAYRILDFSLDPFDRNRAYTAVLNPGMQGMSGSLYRIDELGSSSRTVDITGTLPRAVLSVTVDPHERDSIYVVLHSNGIYHSYNGGESWRALDGKTHGLPDMGFSRLIIHPEDPDRLWLVGGCDVRSDSAASAGLGPNEINKLYESRDGGSHWYPADGLGENGKGSFKSLVFGDEGIIIAVSELSAWYSRDDGESWNEINNLPYQPIAGMAVGSRGSLYLYTSGAGVFTGKMDRNGTVKWSEDSLGSTPIQFAQILEDPRPGGSLYASAYPGGIFRSNNSGKSWQEINFGLPSFTVEDPQRQGYYALALCRSDPDILYLGLYGKGIYRTFNGGDTWYPVPGRSKEMMNRLVTALAVDPRNSDRVWAATKDGKISLTEDAGLNWFDLSRGLPDVDIISLAVDETGHIMAGTVGYGIYLLEGKEWRPLPTFGNWGRFWPIWDNRPLYQYTSLMPHARNPERWMMGTFPQGIYITEDDGATWTQSNIGWTRDGCFRLVSHPKDPDHVFAGTYNGINQSKDFGKHWERSEQGWPPEQWVFSIDFSPQDPDIMVACSKNGENEGRGRDNFRGTVMRSIDGGDNWVPITDGLDPNQEFYEILFDPEDSDVLYLAAQNQGVMISIDGGKSWDSWNNGLDGALPATNGNNVTRCLVLSSDSGSLIYGTNGSGVYRRRRYQR